MRDTPEPYNPLDRVELGKSVERALLAQPLSPLPPEHQFGGAGLYAIYYTGSLEYYAPIAEPLGEIPIYVGRARPSGARQGGLGLDATTSEPKLFDRLNQHAKSIENVEAHHRLTGRPGLRVEDFRCRYLVADDIWVPLGEALLIGHYKPVWNAVADGFGNHSPGGGRSGQARSRWDELHPGRAWAARLPPHPDGADRIWERVRAHLREARPPNLDAAPSVDDQVREALTAEAEA